MVAVISSSSSANTSTVQRVSFGLDHVSSYKQVIYSRIPFSQDRQALAAKGTVFRVFNLGNGANEGSFPLFHRILQNFVIPLFGPTTVA